MSSYISYGGNYSPTYTIINQEVLGTFSENITIYSSKMPIFLPADSLYLKEIALISSSQNFDLDVEFLADLNPIYETNISSSSSFMRKGLTPEILIPSRFLFIRLKPLIQFTDLSITLVLEN